MASSVVLLARSPRFCVRPGRVVVLGVQFFSRRDQSVLDYGFDSHFVTWTPPCRRVA